MLRHPIALCIGLLISVGPVAAAERTPLGEPVERHLSLDEPTTEWTVDPQRLAEQAGDRLETREVVVPTAKTVKLENVVPPIHFASGVAQVPAGAVAALRDVLAGLQDRSNVRLNLVGHADNQPLSPALAATYGDNETLSRERAGEVAELFQAALGLPPEAVSYQWAGDSRPIASNDTEAGRALNRRVEVEVWYDALTDEHREEEFVVTEDIGRVKICRMETVCKLRYVEGHARRARVQHLVDPLYYDPATLQPSPAFLQQIRETLGNLGDKKHVVVKFRGFTDDLPLAERESRIYGDHLSLSKARARRVALAVQEALRLPPDAVASDGYGASRPVAGNNSVRGRALNRRVEVEFWYDDALQELPGEPQLCPADAGADTVTRIYQPSWGRLPPIDIASGQPVVDATLLDMLRRGLDEVADKARPRLRFVGYTRDQGLDRRTALVYGDDVGLSTARARRAMEAVAAELALTPEQVEHEGRGFVHSDDVIASGFEQSDRSYVQVLIVYDELAVVDDYDGVEVSPLTRELAPENPFALNLMRITVDGDPVDDPGHSSEDVQRCTDVAMHAQGMRLAFDSLSVEPRLEVVADRPALPVSTEAPGSVRFRMYSNYAAFIDHAEVRVFDAAGSTRGTPLAVVPVDDDGYAEWLPEVAANSPATELKYLVRAYGAEGRFDETRTHPLWLVRAGPSRSAAGTPMAKPATSADGLAEVEATPAALAGYGSDALSLHNIPLPSGTVRVAGSGLAADREVWVAGSSVPVDERGDFVAESILPKGQHTVEIAVLDPQGNGELYLRDLELEERDWFYAGFADVTWSKSRTSDSAQLFVGDNAVQDFDDSLEGRLALYASGELGDEWRLTTSIDTREGELDQLFGNFLSKDPDALFRRLDPDYHYPTFGDDGTVTELAPTQGKMYFKVDRHDDYGLWGNYKIAYMDNELAQVDRGLYGARGHYQSAATTTFGEQRASLDLFAAEPGTIPSRQEFRGTGGSFYYLRHQDIMMGSERVRVEIRDKSSGLVTGTVDLVPSVDYDVDYLQGTIVLTEPLAGTATDDLLVRSGSAMGDEAYLVVRYEYTPGFEEVDALAVGGETHYWFGDRLKIALTANENRNDDDAFESGLRAADLTYRLSAESWVKVQTAHSDGLLAQTLVSQDGGYEFSGVGDAALIDRSASANRVDVSIGLEDLSERLNGHFVVYRQAANAGYSAPGLETLTDTDTYGGALDLRLTPAMSMRAKSDAMVQAEGITTRAHELDVNYAFSPRWALNTGLRHDQRDSDALTAVPTLDVGTRTDAVVQVGYDTDGGWDAYGFLQDTIARSESREANGRVGVGGSYLVSERLRLDGEVSNGDLGVAGRLGSRYLHSDRTSFYANYALENERSDNGWRSGGRPEGSLVSGMKTRFSDSTSVFLEERYQHSRSSMGLTHAAGVQLTPTERWNLSATTDIGTLEDRLTGAQTDRTAGSVRVGFGSDGLQLSAGVEFREDLAERLDASTIRRETWLYRNTLRWQMNPSSRLLGKLNFSTSDSSLGAVFDGRYTEAVLGYGFRPVRNDRLNVMVKYTYFYSVPTTDQVTVSGVAAEYLQRSHVAAVDLTYQMTRRWRLGGKYAYRLGEISLDREDPEYFDNAASLSVVRSDFRLWQAWELLVEGRMLTMIDLDEQRAGALVAVSRYVGEHLKAGVGYNFTDFSDDLTDLSYDHHGVFLNLTGAF